MAQQIVEGTDNLNEGRIKINNNFSELYPQVDSNTLKVSADGSIGTHSDVDLSGVTIGSNWVLKYDGTKFIPCFKQVNSDSSLTINTSTTPITKLLYSVNFQRLGTYSIKLNYSYSYDATNSSMITNLTIGGVSLANIANGECLRLEPKDATGNDGDGRGTSQKATASNVFYYTPSSIGSENVEFFFNGSANNVEASVWDLSIIIEEEII